MPKKIRINVKDKTISTISLLLTVISILLVIYILGKVAVPQIVESVKSIGIMIKEKWPQWAKTLQKYNVDTAPITEWVKNLDFVNLFKNVLILLKWLLVELPLVLTVLSVPSTSYLKPDINEP